MKRFFLGMLMGIVPLMLFAQVHNVKKGDILVVNGVKGIVFSVKEDGEHGTMMSVKAFRGKKNLFCSQFSLLNKLSMLSQTNGRANTEELFRMAEENQIPLTEYPVFYWCRSLGPGWYIPSVEELKQFINYWLGNTDLEVDWDDDETPTVESDDSTPHTRKVNEIMMNAGGTPFLNGVFTSTLSGNQRIEVFDYNKADGKWTFRKINPMKADAYCVGRAFFDF